MSAIKFDIDELFNQETFKKIPPDKAELIKNLHRDIQGKNTMEMIPILMSYNQKFQKGGVISKEDQSAIITTMKNSLSQQEQQKFDSLLSMVEMMGKQ